MTPARGLMPFILKMLATDRAALERADPVKLAAKYDIPATTAAGFLNGFLGRVM